MTERHFLTKEEVCALLRTAAADPRHGVRNHCLIFMAFRHGFRISELLGLRMTDIDLAARQIYIRRSKNGFSTVHPFDGHEQSVIGNWIRIRKAYPSAARSERLFISEHGISLSRKQAWHLIKKYGQQSDIDIHSHPHMLRHACGYALANEGADTRLIQDYLGHRNIRHTVHYTQGNSERFTRVMQMMDLTVEKKV